jgi:hypothetical protein
MTWKTCKEETITINIAAYLSSYVFGNSPVHIFTNKLLFVSFFPSVPPENPTFDRYCFLPHAFQITIH